MITPVFELFSDCGIAVDVSLFASFTALRPSTFILRLHRASVWRLGSTSPHSQPITKWLLPRQRIAGAERQAVLGRGWGCRGLRFYRWRQLGLVSVTAHATAHQKLLSSPKVTGIGVPTHSGKHCLRAEQDSDINADGTAVLHHCEACAAPNVAV